MGPTLNCDDLHRSVGWGIAISKVVCRRCVTGSSVAVQRLNHYGRRLRIHIRPILHVENPCCCYAFRYCVVPHSAGGWSSSFEEIDISTSRHNLIFVGLLNAFSLEGIERQFYSCFEQSTWSGKYHQSLSIWRSTWHRDWYGAFNLTPSELGVFILKSV